MNTKLHHTPLPDVATVPSELTMGDKWDTRAVSDLIRSKSANGETPSFLFLGADGNTRGFACVPVASRKMG